MAAFDLGSQLDCVQSWLARHLSRLKDLQAMERQQSQADVTKHRLHEAPLSETLISQVAAAGVRSLNYWTITAKG